MIERAVICARCMWSVYAGKRYVKIRGRRRMSIAVNSIEIPVSKKKRISIFLYPVLCVLMRGRRATAIVLRGTRP